MPPKLWRSMSAREYADLFPAGAIRKIAYGLRRLAANGVDLGYDYQPNTPERLGQGNRVFTLNQWQLAEHCNVSRKSIQRYIKVFERYGIVEVKRWRYREFGPSPSSYRLFFGHVIPENWRDGGGEYPVSARDKRGEGKRDSTPRE